MTTRAPFWGGVAASGAALLALLVAALAQITVWAAAFVGCGEFADPEDAFYHSAVNFTTLGYNDIVMSRRWRLLGPLEVANKSLMLGLSAAIPFAVLGRIVEAAHQVTSPKVACGESSPRVSIPPSPHQ